MNENQLKNVIEHGEGRWFDRGIDTGIEATDGEARLEINRKQLVVAGLNQGGYDSVCIPLLPLLAWVKHNHIELWEQA